MRGCIDNPVGAPFSQHNEVSEMHIGIIIVAVVVLLALAGGGSRSGLTGKPTTSSGGPFRSDGSDD